MSARRRLARKGKAGRWWNETARGLRAPTRGFMAPDVFMDDRNLIELSPDQIQRLTNKED